MKQVLQYMNRGETKVVDVPIPQVQKKTALVRTAASLVSAGTERSLVEFAEKSLVQKASSRPDLMKQVVEKAKREGLLTSFESALNRLDQPMPLGYSSAGTIVEVGDGLEGFQVGDHVVCAGGNHAVHAEYEVIPQNLLAHLPEYIPFESACFAGLAAIALNGIHLAHLEAGNKVLVIGLGLLGLLTSRLALASGCEVTATDINEGRIQFARKVGLLAFNREQTIAKSNALTNGHGFDAVLICAATSEDDTVQLAGELARDRGYVISIGVVGLNLPRKTYYEKELHFQVSRSSGPGRYDSHYEEEGVDYPIGYVRWTEGRNLEAFVSLLESGKLQVADLITHRFEIQNASHAYELITGKTKEPYAGVLLTYPLSEEKTNTHISFNIKFAPSSAVNVGVIGAGNYARTTFLPVMRKNRDTHFIGIASINGVNAQHAAAKYGFTYATSSAPEIIQDKAINSVVIMTRHADHAPLCLQALKNHKHVYCEKPLALTLEDIKTLETLLSQPVSPLLMVGFNRRFAPFSVELQKFFSQHSEPMYAHYTVNAGFLPSNHWLHNPIQGGGRIIGEGCHFIDYLTFLIGQPISAVWAKALPDQGKYHQDNVHITVEYADGSIGNIAYLANGNKNYSKERLEVFCAGKVAVLNDFRTLDLISSEQKKHFRNPFRQDKGHRAAWNAFVQAIKSGQSAPIPYEQLISVSRAAILANKSAMENTRITLD